MPAKRYIVRLTEEKRGAAFDNQYVAVSLASWAPQLDADQRSRGVTMDLLHALVD
jgi:hypothetical protein